VYNLPFLAHDRHLKRSGRFHFLSVFTVKPLLCHTLRRAGVKLEPVSGVIFVDVPDVVDGFLTNAFRRNDFDVVEPLVRVQPLILSLARTFAILLSHAQRQ
jgi:hypothetical protein